MTSFKITEFGLQPCATHFIDESHGRPNSWNLGGTRSNHGEMSSRAARRAAEKAGKKALTQLAKQFMREQQGKK